MIKFIHKKHLHNNNSHHGKIIIYYSVLDIFLGVMLMGLVAFFIHDYVSHSFGGSKNSFPMYTGATMLNNNMMNTYSR